MKIVIFGVSGFLGTKLRTLFLEKGHKVLGANLSGDSGFKIDATKLEEVSSFLEKEKPDLIIDTIALTSSLGCERNPEKALSLNYQTAKNIVEVSKKINVSLIFISSSYIFDGLKGNYSEEDKPNPLNEYGKTKVMAEKEVLKLEKGIVLRVDILYGYNQREKRNGIFSQILSGNKIQLREGEQLRQPLFVDDLSEIIIKLIQRNQNGIFHIAGPDRITILDFLKNLEEIVRSESKITLGGSKLPIKIPKNATLNISKIEDLGIKTTPLKEGLAILKSQLE